MRHTSDASFGQVYIPVINWALMIACIALVIGFGSSAALASAYRTEMAGVMAASP